jgi:hypothetical protein
MAFISTQERYSYVLPSMSIVFPFFMISLFKNFILLFFEGSRFLYAPSCGLSLQLVPSLHQTYSSTTPAPLASNPTLLAAGGLNLSAEGVVLLTLRQV